MRLKLIKPKKPGWRNRQTQRTQNPPRATSWGFDPPSRHQDSKNFTCKVASPEREAVFVGGCFTCYLACNEVQRVAFPGFTERSRGRIGVKAAHSTPRYAVTEP